MQAAAFAAAADVGAGAALAPRRHARRDRARSQRRSVRPAAARRRSTRWLPRRPIRASATELYGKPVGRRAGRRSGDPQRHVGRPASGPQAGDVIQVRRWDNGGVAEFIVGAVHRTTPGRRRRAGDVDRAGRQHRLRRPTSVLIYGYQSDQAVDARARRRTAWRRSDVRIGHSVGTRTTPTSTLDLATTKAKLGRVLRTSPAPAATSPSTPAWRRPTSSARAVRRHPDRGHLPQDDRARPSRAR